MSLVRTALRLAVIEALNADLTIDGVCLGRIYDGDLTSAEPVPVITVYTEDDGGEAYSANNGGPPFDEVCELLIEIAMRAVVQGPTPEETTVFIPASDRQLEAMIDLLEQRAVDAITVGETPQSALVRKVVRRVTAYKSMRFASEETSTKLAIRMLHLTVQLFAAHEDDPLDPPIGPFAVLPDPLRTVCIGMPDGSSGQKLCTLLAAQITRPTWPAFDGVVATLAPTTALNPIAPPTPDGADRGPRVVVSTSPTSS